MLNYFSEFPGNWLGRHGAGAIPSNVDENDQGSEVDSSLNKSPIPLGRPSNCPKHFSEFENPCRVKLSRLNYLFRLIQCIYYVLDILLYNQDSSI